MISGNCTIHFSFVTRLAFSRFRKNPYLIENNYGDLASFVECNSSWLIPYAKFQSYKYAHNFKPWWEWSLRQQNDSSNTEMCEDEYEFHIFLQYLFRAQWDKLKCYANENGIKIIGDLPIYVAPDSSDVWANKDLFQLDQVGQFSAVAGVPPDYFNQFGQLWGNPLYNWENHLSDQYSWWMNRISDQLSLFDVLRIDHFRAFHDFWSIPFGSNDARTGEWKSGPGAKFWETVKAKFPELPFLAEDLGDISKDVRSLRTSFSLPGMAVLQFAFDGNPANLYLPTIYPRT